VVGSSPKGGGRSGGDGFNSEGSDSTLAEDTMLGKGSGALTHFIF
jgi:hypothetical protein